MTHLHVVPTDLEQRAAANRPIHPLVRAGPLRGEWVFGPSGAKVGRIWDVALEKDSGRAAYVILARGGLFGVGRRLSAIPWSFLRRDVTVGRRTKGYVIPCEPADLDRAQGLGSKELGSFAPPTPRIPAAALRPPS